MVKHTPQRRAAGRRIEFVILSLALLTLGPSNGVPGIGTDGRDLTYKPSNRPTIEAAFSRESYRPGAVARLVIFSRRSEEVSLQVFRAGTEPGSISARDEMRGIPVTDLQRLGSLRSRQSVQVRIPGSPSGLYFAKLTGRRGRIGYAPFVLRPQRLGEHRIAEVLPTLTWQAYNRRDDDGDGEGDTWYVNQQGNKTARLYRPHRDRGVPENYKYYDQPFLRWLTHTHRDVDYLAQTDLARTTGRSLAAAYELIVFSGHHEYVTAAEYGAVEGFRNRGGNLMFLSANNFFWKVEIREGVMHKVAMWRNIGRPEAALVGVQYIGYDNGEHRLPYTVRDVRAAPWLFAGTGLHNGSKFGDAGIEIDKTQPSSPAGTRVIAELPNLFGRGMTAQMTYYERGGAKVFAAGAFTFAGAVWWPKNRLLMENLWRKLARP
jgi:N,N-dimethylformamidase